MELENINTENILDEVNQDIIDMFEPFFEALKPKEVEPENDDTDETYI